MRRQARRLVRAVRVLAHIGAGLLQAARLGASTRPEQPAVRQASRAWLGRLCRLLAVEVQVVGQPCAGPALLAANHVSWVDIAVVGGIVDARFLSKAEVARWPLIGRLARAAGTLFIHRGAGEARACAQAIATVLAARQAVLVFPEGTTSAGDRVRAFHRPLFAAATGGGHAVQPVAIRYLDGDGRPHPAAPFVGDDGFVPHLWRLLLVDRLPVRLHFLEPLAAHPGSDTRGLAAAAQAAVQAALRSG